MRAEPGKSMYQFYFQLEGQPAQLSQEEDCLKRVNCSNLAYDASKPIEKNGHLTCFAEHAVSISNILDTQEFFQEAQVKDMCRGDF